jgi:hypothetical protein
MFVNFSNKLDPTEMVTVLFSDPEIEQWIFNIEYWPSAILTIIADGYTRLGNDVFFFCNSQTRSVVAAMHHRTWLC